MNAKRFMERYGATAIYAALMLGTGVWQLLDWHFGAEDPIWHLLFYLLIMPFLSFGYGFFAGDRYKPWILPLTAGFLSAFVYAFMSNGGLSLDIVGALELCVPSAISAFVGVSIRRLLMLFG